MQAEEGSNDVAYRATNTAASSPRDRAKRDNAEMLHTSSVDVSCDETGAKQRIVSRTVHSSLDFRVDLSTV